MECKDLKEARRRFKKDNKQRTAARKQDQEDKDERAQIELYRPSRRDSGRGSPTPVPDANLRSTIRCTGLFSKVFSYLSFTLLYLLFYVFRICCCCFPRRIQRATYRGVIKHRMISLFVVVLFSFTGVVTWLTKESALQTRFKARSTSQSGSSLLLNSCSPKKVVSKKTVDELAERLFGIQTSSLRGLHADRDFAVGEFLVAKNTPITTELMKQIFYINSAAVPDFDTIFAKGQNTKTILKKWNQYQKQSLNNANIRIVQQMSQAWEEADTMDTMLSIIKKNPYTSTISMEIIVIKPIKKGEAILRDYGLTWISLVHQHCSNAYNKICFYNKNFKNADDPREMICKTRGETDSHFASLWTQEERDHEDLVLMDKPTSKRYRKVLDKLYELILPEASKQSQHNFIYEMLYTSRGMTKSRKSIKDYLKRTTYWEKTK